MLSLRHMFVYLYCIICLHVCLFLSERVPWLFGPEASLE